VRLLETPKFCGEVDNAWRHPDKLSGEATGQIRHKQNISNFRSGNPAQNATETLYLKTSAATGETPRSPRGFTLTV
jgi:hypothetical protein